MSSFQLYLADAIDLMRSLPDESIDLIVTDVAYESLEKHRAVGTTTRLKQSDASSNEWFPIFGNERFEELFSESFRVLKKNTHLYFYCDEDTADVAKPIGRGAGFKFWKSLVWAKTRQNTKPDADDLVVEHQAMGMGYHYRSSKEFILFFEKGKRKLTSLGVRDVLPFPTITNGYPTEKPVDLNKVFIRMSSLPGETVLDPFMGSASTGVAAVKLGRDFIGGDVKDTAVAAADVRLKMNEGQGRGEVIVLQASSERPSRPEPVKKTRAKKVAPREPDPDCSLDLLDPSPAPPLHPHAYPGVIGAVPSGKFLFTSDCAFGCGCWMGASQSGGPVDPFGECPKHDASFVMPESYEDRRALRSAEPSDDLV